MLKLLLADDHTMFRDGLQNLFEQQPGMQVVGQAQDGVVAAKLAFELKPDVVLMDLTMPVLNGIEATRRIREESPTVRVLILSMHADLRFVTESLRAGAAGYLLKDSGFKQLVQAVRQAMTGQLVLSEKISDVLARDYVRVIGRDGASAFVVLSAREREVLQLIAEGRSTREVAAKLNVSIKTVETHRRQIMEKLDIHSIAELTKYAIREGITGLS
jgi:DNA-binding NarL/FixJ family response regulator